jgi:hypothetical protein
MQFKREQKHIGLLFMRTRCLDCNITGTISDYRSKQREQGKRAEANSPYALELWLMRITKIYKTK